jgi:hypothetical protein
MRIRGGIFNYKLSEFIPKSLLNLHALRTFSKKEYDRNRVDEFILIFVLFNNVYHSTGHTEPLARITLAVFQ